MNALICPAIDDVPLARGEGNRWACRLLLGLIAIGGSVLYALSFYRHDDPTGFLLALHVGLAAGLSWPVLGLALMMVSGRGMAHADACLATMAVGIGVLSISVLSNQVVQPPLAFHAGVMIAADVAMAGVFVAGAPRRGVGRTAAALLWVGVLNGTFLVVLFLTLLRGVR